MVTVITKTINASGGDYASFSLAEADVTNIGTSADLVANDEAIVFEVAKGIYPENVTFLSTLTTDATHQVTYRPAAGSEHGGKISGGVELGTGVSTIDVRDDYTVLIGLRIEGQHTVSGDGCRANGCIITRFSGNCAGTNGPGNSVRIVWENCIFRPAGTAFGIQAYGQRGDSTIGVYNCTFAFQPGATNARGIQSFVDPSFENDFDIVNCLSLVGGNTYLESGPGTHTLTGSNNVHGAQGPLPVGLQANGQTWDVTTDLTLASDGNNAIYDSDSLKLTDAAGNDAIFVGISPASDSDVPATDIVGIYRGLTTTNVGAFQRLKHIWTDIMATSRDSVDVLGVLKMGAGYINAKQTVLTATGPSGTDDTPMIPAGTTALWIQHLTATGAATDITETCTLSVHIDGSTSLDLLNFGTFSVPTQNSRAGFFQLPIEVTVTDGTYPFIRATNASAVDAAEVHEFRVVAIGEPGPSWS
jgi:hypothetical protein